MMGVRSVPTAAAVIAAVMWFGPPMFAPAQPGTGPAGTPPRTRGTLAPSVVSVSPDHVTVGDPLSVMLVGWQPGPVTVAVCGNAAMRGSTDCDLIGADAVGIGASGVGSATLKATPPVGCPCVVRATSAAVIEAPVAPIVITGVDVSDAPPRSDVPAANAPADQVNVRVRWVDAPDTGLALGTRQDRIVLLSVKNLGATTVRGLRATMALGRDAVAGEPVAAPAIAPLAPDEERTYAVPVTIHSPTFGSYVVFGRMHGLTSPVPFAATTSTQPVGLIGAGGAGAAVLVACSGLRARHRRRRVHPVDDLIDELFEGAEPESVDLHHPHLTGAVP